MRRNGPQAQERNGLKKYATGTKWLGRGIFDRHLCVDRSSYRKSFPWVTAWLKETISSGDVFTSVIIYHELLMGARIAKAQKTIKALLENWEIAPMDREIAEAAGQLRRDEAKKGRAMSLADSLIAATASVQGKKVVTSNLKGFPASIAVSPEIVAER